MVFDAFLTLAMTYAVMPVVIPPGYHPPLNTPQRYERTWRPELTYVNLSAAGALAFLLQNSASRTNLLELVRVNGKPLEIPLPSDALVQQRMIIGNSPGFSAVAVSEDGEPFATVSSCFSGAGPLSDSGCRKASFVWRGAWHGALPDDTPGRASNFRIVAAREPGSAVFNSDFDDRLPRQEYYPEAYLEHVVALRNGVAVDLGEGDATAMRGDFIVGFRAGLGLFPRGATNADAMEWHGTNRKRLGPGVALAVNARGDAVGDDEQTYSGSGNPTLWSNGRVFRLSLEAGTANGIADDGTIVGTIFARGGFVCDAHRRMYALDDLLSDRGWHVSQTYGIASDGRIAASASKNAGTEQLVMLVPSDHSSSR